MDTFSLVLVVVGGFVLVAGLFSALIKSRLFITAPLIGLIMGVLLGPEVLALFDPAEWGDPFTVFEIATGLTLAIALMEIALRLPRHFVFDYWKPLTLLILIVMPAGWIVTGSLVYLAFGTSWMVALLVGAVAAPTDPVVATSIISVRFFTLPVFVLLGVAIP